MKVIGKRILVKVIPPPSVSKSRLYIAPTSEVGEVVTGKVIAIGCDIESINIDDVIYFDRFPARKVSVDSENYYVISEQDILLIID
jgi:co-chaperonin GroES (HSP10)